MYDLGEIMSTPPMYRDIGESFMTDQMPMPMMGMGIGMYSPYAGASNYMMPKIGKNLPQDIYQKKQNKTTSEKGVVKKILASTGIAALALYCLRKVPVKSIFKATKSTINWVSGWVKYGCNKITTFFKGLNIPKAPTP